MDLNQASRETLLAVIAEQQGVITELRHRVEGLEAQLSNGGGRGSRMPGHKPAARRKKPAADEKKLRKKRRHGFARPRMEPTGRVVHAPESCPECHTALAGGWVQRTREVIDIPVFPAEVTEHVFIARTCPLCRKRRLPQDSLSEIAVGRQRLGVNLVSLMVTLREEGRLPLRTIQSASVPSVETERWGHRPGSPSGCPAGRSGSGQGPGAHPFQPGGPRR